MGNSQSNTGRNSALNLLPSQLESAVLTAVTLDNVGLLKYLIKKTNVSINAKSSDGNQFLHIAILNDSLDIFNYLIKRDDLEVNALSDQQISALTMAVMSDKIYYVKKLIERGADVNPPVHSWHTPLHYASESNSSEICHLLLTRESEINAQNQRGQTPLLLACGSGRTEIIYMLLYYGADASIPCQNGYIPLLVDKFSTFDLDLQQILYSHTFDEMGCSMELKVLTKAMGKKWPLFPLMLSKVSHLIYDADDLQNLVETLVDVKSEHLKIFLKKFGHVFEDMLCHFCVLTTFLKFGESLKKVTSEFLDLTNVLFESEFVFEVVQSYCVSISPISSLVNIFRKSKLPLTSLTELVCCLLSYGVTVTPTDLNAVYVFYGRCELFEIMLHMEIETPKESVPCCTLYDHEVIQKSIMPYFIYDINLNIEKFLENPQPYLLMDLNVLLNYFALPRLKEFFLSDGGDKVARKIQNLPSVPTLIELARNVARDYIIAKHHIKNSSQFYTVIKWLPLNKVYKKILTFETSLYD